MNAIDPCLADVVAYYAIGIFIGLLASYIWRDL